MPVGVSYREICASPVLGLSRSWAGVSLARDPDQAGVCGRLGEDRERDQN